MSSEKDILFKKLDYLNSEYQYKRDLLKKIDIEFNIKLNEVIESHNELKDIVDSEEVIDSNENSNNHEFISEEMKVIVSEDLKDIYRKITRVTHPDRINNIYLNNIYIETNKCYEDGDEIGLYNSAYKIGIDFNINQKLEGDIISKIDQIQNNIKLLENSYPWKWFHSNQNDKDNIIVDFIGKNIVG